MRERLNITGKGARRLAMALAVAGLAMPLPAFAAPAAAAAGGAINNVAQIAFQGSAGPVTANSNLVTLRVQQLIDVAAQPVGPTVAVNAASTGQVLPFTVTNTGNGQTPFTLTATAAAGDFTPAITKIVVDSNGNGVLDSGDTVYAGPASAPVIAAGASVTVFVVSDIPADVADGQQGRVTLNVGAVGAQAPAGTLLSGFGASGVDAVVGASAGQASAQGAYVAGAVTAQLIKSQSVRDADGGQHVVPGSVITYSLEARFTGAGLRPHVVITDTAPAGTTYVAGSLKLDGAALSDAADGDAGSVLAGALSVALGDIDGGADHIVTFQVSINSTEAPGQ